MALRVWLPLIGNLKNQGLSDLGFSTISTDTTINNDGKIGKCYQNSSFTAGGLVSDKKIALGPNQSMFCWFKITTLNSSSTLGGGLVTNHRHGDNAGMGITIKYASSTTGYLSVNTGNGTNRSYNLYTGTTLLQANTWYHGGYTYDGQNIRLYVNGSLEGTYNVTGMYTPEEFIGIFCWSFDSNGAYGNYKFNGAINDVRIYDHCLSTKEVKEISKGLILHYKLDGNSTVDNIEFDCSGYGTNGTIVGGPTLVTTGSPRYDACKEFTTNKYITVGRNPMVKDEITVSLWGYMGTWSYNGRMISCTQTGGWNFEGNASNTGASMEFLVYASGSSAGYVRAVDNVMIKNLSSGWHHFVGTYSNKGNKVCYYRDGNFISSATTGSRPIGYHAANGIFVAAESNTTVSTPTTPYFPGRLSDVRIYATAISPADVLELYHTPASVDNKGNFYCGELKEN